MKVIWILMRMIVGEPCPHAVFSSYEKMEAYVRGKGGEIDGTHWDCEEMDVDPEPKQ
jgi:hypothetical protein